MIYLFTYYQNGILRRHTCFTDKEATTYFDLLIIMKVESIRVQTIARH